MAKSDSKSGNNRRMDKLDDSSDTVKFLKALVDLRNLHVNESNRLIAPLITEMRFKSASGSVNEKFLLDYKHRIRVQQKEYRRLTEATDKESQIGIFMTDMRKHLEPVGRSPSQLGSIFPSWYEYLAHRALDLQNNQQPGLLVQGGLDHPCEAWYARTEQLQWISHYGPTLYPYDPALTGFGSNWMDDTRFQVCLSIENDHDDHFTQYYNSRTTFHTATEPLPRRGKIGFRFKADFVNAMLYGRGSDDWNIFGYVNDYGFAGAYYAVAIRRHRGDTSELVYTTTNLVPPSAYYGTMFVPLLSIAIDSAITAQGWPGGVPGHIWVPIPSLDLYISAGSNGHAILMQPGDRFSIALWFLFDVQAYGDEGAAGGVQIWNYMGSDGYVDVAPIELLLEECAAPRQ